MDISLILSDIPITLKKPLLDSFNEIVKNYKERRWEPSELNGGKFCEIVYTILKGFTDGRYSASPSKPRNMLDSCRNLENAESTRFSRSVRIQIPRMLIALYEIRNNRGVGHVGGDVDPNHMDSHIVLEMCKWILAELIRIFHNVSVSEATNIVESLMEKTIPVIWEVDGVYRVLNTTLSRKDQTLLLLYASSGIHLSNLLKYIEYSNNSVFKTNVLSPLHNKRYLEYNKETDIVKISPKGIQYVEENLSLELIIEN